MLREQCENFEIEYTVRTNAQPESDIQFGMDFKLTHSKRLALCQLIYPATSVGTNVKNQWNIDNHAQGTDPDSLIFANAGSGTINDIPTEIRRPGTDAVTTKFAVYAINLSEAVVYKVGVQFGYSINPSAKQPITTFLGLQKSIIPTDQKTVILARCKYIKFQ